MYLVLCQVSFVHLFVHINIHIYIYIYVHLNKLIPYLDFHVEWDLRSTTVFTQIFQTCANHVIQKGTFQVILDIKRFGNNASRQGVKQRKRSTGRRKGSHDSF